MRSRRALILGAGSLLLGLLLIAGGWIARRPAWKVGIDIGAEGVFPAEGYTDQVRNFYGFQPAERAADSGRDFRWTNERATLSLPYALRVSPPLEADLVICACRPDGNGAPVTVAIDNTPVATWVAGNDFRHVVLQVPGGLSHPTYDLLMTITTPAWSAADGRSLGIAVDSIEVRQIATTPLSDPLSILVAIGAVALLAWSSRGLLLPALLSASWLLVQLVYQPQLLPRWLLALGLIGGLITLWSLRGSTWLALGATVLALWLVLSPQLFGSWMLDDAFISFRYARELLRGNGLVFNAGERVEGYTNFLWTIMISGSMLLQWDPVVVASGLTFCLAFLLLLLTSRVAQRIVPRDFLWIAPILVAVSSPFLLYTTRGSGMETSLFATLLLASSLMLIDKRWSLAGALTALTILTRPDGVLLAGIGTLYAFWNGRQVRGSGLGAAVRYAGTVAGIFGPYFVWRWTYYGYLLPNTFYSKVGGTEAQLLRGLEYLGAYTRQQLLLVVGGLGAILGGWLWWHKHDLRWGAGALLTAIVVCYSGYIAAVGGDWMPGFRFMMPLVPLLALLTAWGVAGVARRWEWMRWPMQALVIALVGLLVLRLPGDSSFDTASPVWRENDVVGRYREVGRWLAAFTPGDTWIAAAAAGALPFYADRPTIDVLGLNDLHIAHLPSTTLGQGKPGHEKTDPAYVLSRRPVIVPYVAAPYVADAPGFDANYRLEQVAGAEGRRVQLYVRRDVVLPTR